MQQILHARPGLVAVLWLQYTLLLVLDAVLIPDSWVTSVIFHSGTPVFAGMLAGWALRLRAGTFGLIAALCMIGIFLEGIWLSWRLLAGGPATVPEQAFLIVVGATIVVALVLRSYPSRSRSKRLLAIALVLLANFAAITFTLTDDLFWKASQKAQYFLYAMPPPESRAEASDPMAAVALDELWEAQPALLAKEAEALETPRAGEPNVYVIAVAAGGEQQLFSREAKLALEVAAKRFRGSYRGGMLLSNGAIDMLKRPLATRTNFALAARRLGAKIKGSNDIAMIYLAAHGSHEAFLGTNLPNAQELTPISAESVRKALAHAGIGRRVIVVSACFSASWIPALTNDDTILIAAAAKDRTSFGCDDSRDVTYFGEAFLKGPLAQGASLRTAFEAARSKIADWEKMEKLDPSKPQAYIGRNMRDLWEAKGLYGGRGRD